MIIANKSITPVLMYLPDTEYWVARWEKCKKHLDERGFKDVYHVAGIHGEKFGIEGTHYYERDNPGGKHKIGTANTAGFLSMYVVYNVCKALGDDYFLVMEDDCRYKEDIMEQLEKNLAIIPDDFDFLFVGSCCGIHASPIEYKGESLYFFPKEGRGEGIYPMCGHSYIVARKALDTIIATQRDAYANADINLALHTFPLLNVYAIFPRLAEQENNEHLNH